MAYSLLCSLLLISGIIADKYDNETMEGYSRISNGKPTNIEQYRSLVQVEFFLEYKGIWDQNCAGNILTERHVLSAAHCFTGPGYRTSFRRIRAGTTVRNLAGFVVYVNKEIIHPNFGKSGLEGDIAVVLLTNRLKFSPAIRPAVIASSGTVIPDNTEVRVAGWGATSQHGGPSDTLLAITIYTVNNELCARRYQMIPHPLFVTKKMICAGLLDEGDRREVCPGDSGGGLFYGDLLVGIVSWGKGCDKLSLPGVYTALSFYTNWILSMIS